MRTGSLCTTSSTTYLAESPPSTAVKSRRSPMRWEARLNLDGTRIKQCLGALSLKQPYSIQATSDSFATGTSRIGRLRQRTLHSRQFIPAWREGLDETS